MSYGKMQTNLRVRRLMRALFAYALSLLLVATAAAPSPRHSLAASVKGETDAADLYQSLLDLTNPWTVMCVAAHPDDEDGATLTVLRRKYGAHTVTLFATYGEGGQNATGPELYEELGAIRARETIEAAAIQGSEAYFLGLRDFGFSKSADETFRVWGHTEALARMVLKIRTLRPDVIITNHDTVSGHGHHQATGRLVLEAFDAAADPQRFPEQLLSEGVSVWQAQRLFVRVNYERGAGSKAAGTEALRAGALVSIDANERDPARRSTYAEQALSALQHHASQGPWPQTVPAGGVPAIRYRLARRSKQAAPLPSAPARSLLDGLTLPVEIAERLTPLATKVLLPLYLANPERRESVTSVLGSLISVRRAGGLFAAPEGSRDSPRFRLMNERFDRALAAASGMTLTITPRATVLVPDTQTDFSVNLSYTGTGAPRVRSLSFEGEKERKNLAAPDRLLSSQATISLTAPYHVPRDAWINTPRAAHLYDGHLFGEQFKARADVEIDGVSFPLEALTRVDVAPPVEIRGVEPSLLILTPGTIGRPVNLIFRVVNHRPTPFGGRIGSANPEDLTGYTSAPFKLNSNQALDVPLEAPPYLFGRLGPNDQQPQPPVPKGVLFMIWDYPRASEPVAHRIVPVVYSDARVAPRLRVGYIRSFDNTLRDALFALGVENKELTVNEVRAGNLQSYDTIIIDNRGYQAHPELVTANARLLEYVHAGGTLIVFYHKTNEWNPDPRKKRPQLAPYPIILGNERVTDETAPVRFTDPRHELLNLPNKIVSEDFAGWIQERGLYYPQQWDNLYSAPLSASDPHEAPLRGGLLAAAYGRGRYIYTSMVWYRQLRAGVPGAYRVFANMLSYGHTNKGAGR